MRRALGFTLFVIGCASGAQPNGADDAPLGGHDAPPRVDAPERIDASLAHDAPAQHDAPTQHDAAVDAAVVVDARPIDAPPPPPPDACVPQATQILVNPSFDASPIGTGWTETRIENNPLIGSDVSPQQSAPYAVFLGGLVADEFDTVTDKLTQDVAIPAGTTSLQLTGFYAVITDESASTSSVYDTADLALTKTNGTVIEDVEPLTNKSHVSTWTAFSHTFANPAALAGTTVRVRMTSTNDDSNQTGFFFDTFVLTATHCP